MTDKYPNISVSRHKKTWVKSAKGRKKSSVRWLERQLNDPYVAEAKKQGFRSRAIFKIMQLNDRFKFFKAGKKVVDLGAAPGGWSQIAVEKCGKNNVVGIDLLEIDSIEGAEFIQGDFLEPENQQKILDLLKGKVDIVMSDMAAATTGHAATDHLRIMILVETSLNFAKKILAKEGVFIAKLFQGGAEKKLLDALKKNFKIVKHAKPEASRKDSSEEYVIATGFKNKDENETSE